MQKKRIMVLFASSILIAGLLVAGCTDTSSSVETSTTLSSIPTIAQAAESAPEGDTGDKPRFNESAEAMGTPLDGMQMNGTRPSGTPPDGMQMNGTRPSGTPPYGMQIGGSPPSGSPPSGS